MIVLRKIRLFLRREEERCAVTACLLFEQGTQIRRDGEHLVDGAVELRVERRVPRCVGEMAREQAVELLPERQLDVVEAAAGVERELLEVGVAGAVAAAVLRAREEAGRRRVADAVDRHGGAGRQSGGEEKEEREECAEKLAHVERHTLSNKVEHLSYISYFAEGRRIPAY